MRKIVLVSVAAFALIAGTAAADAGDPATGALVGAGAGALIAGPIGALVGAVTGALVATQVPPHRRARACWQDEFGRSHCRWR